MRAFGLELEASFEAGGLSPACGPRMGRPARVDLVPREAIDGDWPGSGTVRVLEEPAAAAAPARTIDAHPRLGYRLYARRFGLARISPDGSRIACAPPGAATWSWQRFLVGRVLPWAAVLRGYEVLHASAVEIDGRVVAIAGPTGAGKTSLAVQLLALGAGFVTDDALAIDRRDGVVRGHPGAAIASVRPAERAAIPRATWRGLGAVLGRSGKTYLSIEPVDRPLPLAAVCFLSTGHGPPVEPLERADPRLLLASTFVLGVQTPKRLRNQLDLCAAIAREVPMLQLRVSAGVGASELAARLHEQLHAAVTAR